MGVLEMNTSSWWIFQCAGVKYDVSQGKRWCNQYQTLHSSPPIQKIDRMGSSCIPWEVLYTMSTRCRWSMVVAIISNLECMMTVPTLWLQMEEWLVNMSYVFIQKEFKEALLYSKTDKNTLRKKKMTPNNCLIADLWYIWCSLVNVIHQKRISFPKAVFVGHWKWQSLLYFLFLLLLPERSELN